MLYLFIFVVCVNFDFVEIVIILKVVWNILYIVVYIYFVVSYFFLCNFIVVIV